MSHQFRNVHFDEGFGSLFKDSGRRLQAVRSSFGGIGLRARVTEHQREDAGAKTAPEFKQDVSADRTPDERGSANADGIEHPSNVVRMLCHQGRAVANLGLSVA